VRTGLLAAAVTGVQVGAALVATEAIVADVGAGLLGALRYAVALCLLVPVALASRSAPVAARDLLPVALIGIGQFGLLIALLNLSVTYTSSARAALVFATLPLATLAIGRLVRGTTVRRAELAAVTGSVAGVAVLLGGTAATGGLDPRELAGLGCAALATATGALCSILYAPYLARYGVPKVSAIAMAASLAPLSLMAALEGGGAPPASWSTGTLALIGFIGVSSGVGFLLWLFALSRAPAGIVTAFLGLGPVTAVALSVVLLGEPVTPALAVALVLVLGSLGALARGSVRRTQTGQSDGAAVFGPDRPGRASADGGR